MVGRGGPVRHVNPKGGRKVGICMKVSEMSGDRAEQKGLPALNQSRKHSTNLV